jgi:protease YdgD
MMRLSAVILALGLTGFGGMALAETTGIPAANAGLVALQTADDSRGWEAVGRLNLGNRGFCTGALIAEDLVLTAAHCLFDKETGARVDPATIQFLAGWRNGRALAYRGVRLAIAHPEYVYGGDRGIDRVTFDLALIQLDQPVRLSQVQPFDLDIQPDTGDEVGIVSYAQDRAEVPSLQETCHVLSREPVALVMDCSVDFGASGAPVFSFKDGVARVVSVVSAKAQLEGQAVSLGVALDEPLAELRAQLAAQGAGTTGRAGVRVLSGGNALGAKFMQAPEAEQTP